MFLSVIYLYFSLIFFEIEIDRNASPSTPQKLFMEVIKTYGENQMMLS
jgi:hypothetical protein